VSFWAPDGPATDVVEQARAWLDGADDVPLVVATSGSTGEPKRVRLPRAAVLASIAASAARLGATGRWVLALPATYVAGVQVVLRSLVAGHDPVLLDRDGWPDGEGWFVSLVPTQLTRMLDQPEDLAALRRAHTVLLGGGPIGASLRARAADAGVHVVATYLPATKGTDVMVALDGVPTGTQCELVAVSRDGREEATGPWTVTYTGTFHWTGWVAMADEEIASWEVRSTDGQTLVSVPA